MAQNVSYNYADRIIRYAMRDAGLLQDGDDPNSEELAENMNRLNDLIGLWVTQGLKLWTNTDLSITLIAGQALYTMGPSGTIVMARPMRCIGGYYLDSSNNRRPLIALSRDEYTRLANVTQQGAINSYFWDKQQINSNVTFWLTPDSTAATGTAHLIIQNHITFVASLTDQINFPDEWYMALRWGLADDISTGQPQSVIERCAQKAGMYRTMLEDWDTEDSSTFFQPDIRTGYGYGNYR